mmetsp:Transcript_4120/g.12621  ORF Transcript_4120/g.12621 Transcript_4120/m.12621 type:complete len:314 (-) Transcript_4120:98-1039(-)
MSEAAGESEPSQFSPLVSGHAPTIESLMRSVIWHPEEEEEERSPSRKRRREAESSALRRAPSWGDDVEPADGFIDCPLAPPIKHRFLDVTLPRSAKKLKRLLVVDDSYAVRSYLQRVFLQNGYDVDVAQNGWHAFASMQSRVYDFVFLDIEMPVMNGFRCTQALRQWEKHVDRPQRQHICAFTSHTEPHELTLGTQLGIDQFEAKPSRKSRLLHILDTAFAKTRVDGPHPVDAPSTPHPGHPLPLHSGVPLLLALPPAAACEELEQGTEQTGSGDSDAPADSHGLSPPLPPQLPHRRLLPPTPPPNPPPSTGD